jgi:hypothetical protein
MHVRPRSFPDDLELLRLVRGRGLATLRASSGKLEMAFREGCFSGDRATPHLG